jgi:hypothetical protein
MINVWRRGIPVDESAVIAGGSAFVMAVARAKFTGSVVITSSRAVLPCWSASRAHAGMIFNSMDVVAMEYIVASRGRIQPWKLAATE